MTPVHHRTRSTPKGVPAPKKPFRIEKLEERIAPKKGGHRTQGCGDTSLIGGTVY